MCYQASERWVQGDAMAVCAAFRPICGNLNRKNFHRVCDASIPPNDAGDAILSVAARPIRTETGKFFVSLLFVSCDQTAIDSLTYPQCGNVIGKSMNDQHHLPWPFVARLLSTTVHIATIVLNDSSIGIHRVPNVVFISIFWICALAA